MISAVNKWLEDRKFINDYKLGTHKIVQIASIKDKEYHRN